jgi:hypothetical protein
METRTTDLKPITMTAGMRLNKRGKHRIPTEPDTYKIVPIIEEINQKVNRTSISKLFTFVSDMSNVVGANMNKVHFKSKDEFKEFREDRKMFIMKKIFTTKDDVVMVNPDCYKWINSSLTPEGIRIMIGFIHNINNNLIDKKRDGATEEPLEKFDINNFKNKLKYFGLFSEDKPNEKISYKQIREEFEIRRNLISEKGTAMDELNDNFVYLRDNYESYLKEILSIIPSE